MYRHLHANLSDITFIMVVKLAIAFVAIAIVSAEHHDIKEEIDYHDDHHHYEKPAPYHFGYDVADEHGLKHHYEESDGHGNVKGIYGYIDKDGIHRLVEYVADEHGFRANVKTNEPGTKNESPADTHFYSHHDPHEKNHHEETYEDAEQDSSPFHEDEHDGHKKA